VTAHEPPVLMPSEVSSRVGPFDRFAGFSSKIASRAAFFTMCVVLVIVWHRRSSSSAVSIPGSDHHTITNDHHIS